MTFEELDGDRSSSEWTESASAALEEVLAWASPQGRLTVGVYETAKSLNADPDNVALCVLATDEEEAKDVGLQIHFTLIGAFCRENDINVVRANGTRRLAEILAGSGKAGGEQTDLRCILVTSPRAAARKNRALRELYRFCSESRRTDQWAPVIDLPER